MAGKKTLPVPDGLKEAGEAMWREVTSVYSLRMDELRTLEAACRALDRVRAMERRLGRSVTTKGSTGQLVVHPLIPEIRAHEAQIASLLAKLKLPDIVEGEQAGPVSQQRAAAQSRWAAAHGAAS